MNYHVMFTKDAEVIINRVCVEPPFREYGFDFGNVFSWIGAAETERDAIMKAAKYYLDYENVSDDARNQWMDTITKTCDEEYGRQDGD